MKTRFTYKGFDVELIHDISMGDYYMAQRRQKCIYSGYLLDSDVKTLEKAEHYIKHLINEFWLGCFNNGYWGEILPDIQTPKKLNEFVRQLEEEFDSEFI